MPKATKDKLGLVQPFVVFQAYFPRGKLLTLEIGFTDNTGTLRRLIFTQGRDIVKNQLHARIPIDAVLRDAWVNLCIDVASFVRECFPSCTFRSVDCICISGMCYIKRIFTMRMRLRDTTGDDGSTNYYDEPVPYQCDFAKYSTCVNQSLDIEHVYSSRPLAYSTSPPKKKKKVSTEAKYSTIFSPPRRLLPKKGLKELPVQQDNDYVAESPTTTLHNYEVRLKVPRKDMWMTGLKPSGQGDRGSLFDRMKQVEVRHFTPPFVNIEDSETQLRYNPELKVYEMAGAI